MQRNSFLIMILVIVSLIAPGCGLLQTTPLNQPVVGEISYTVINVPSPEADKFLSDDIRTWYEKNYKLIGLHSISKGSDQFLLLSAGEKKTGGYTIEGLKITGKVNEIEVKGNIKAPSSGALVTQVVSYPHILILIPEDNRRLVFNGWETFGPDFHY